jgi:pimeloyl-ACP methyl ester carboxylesterase
MHLTLDRLAILLGVLLGLGGILWMAVVSLMAWAMLRPPRMSAGKAIYHLRRLSPGDLGLSFEEENFRIRDVYTGKPMHIAGWWIPASAPNDRCVLLIHGYADAKVGAIAWAPLLHRLGLNILAIDLRAHGDSGGRFSTGGFWERDDLGQVIDEIIASRPNQTGKIILFGISLGAAVAVAVAARRSDIAGLILESPFADYQRAIAAHARLLGLPGGATLKCAIRGAQRLSGAHFEQVSTAALLKQLKCPVLSIVGCEDQLLDATDIAELQRATQQRPGARCWLVENAGHLQAMSTQPLEYEAAVRTFLQSLCP